MKVIVIEDVSADEFQAVLAELKGSQLRVALDAKQLEVPKSAVPISRGGKPKHASPKRFNHYSQREKGLIKAFHKDPSNHWSNGRWRKDKVIAFGLTLGRTYANLEKQLSKMRLRKVVGTAHQHFKHGVKATVVKAPMMKYGVPVWSRAEFKKDYLSGMDEAVMAKKYGIAVATVDTRRERMRLHRPSVMKPTTKMKGFRDGHGLRWTPALRRVLTKSYHKVPTKELAARFGISENAVSKEAYRMGITIKRKETSKGAYMLRRKAVVPKEVVAGVISPLEVVEAPVAFPTLRGVDCQPEHVRRSFLSLAKGEFREINYSGIGGFVLGITSPESWEDFVVDALSKFDVIARVLGVGNKFRAVVDGGARVIRYG